MSLFARSPESRAQSAVQEHLSKPLAEIGFFAREIDAVTAPVLAAFRRGDEAGLRGALSRAETALRHAEPRQHARKMGFSRFEADLIVFDVTARLEMLLELQQETVLDRR